MPINYARRLTSTERSARSDRHLGAALAFVAGAANAGAFLSVRVYTSHMTGIVSSMADDLALGEYGPAALAFGGVACFLLGGIVSTVMIQFARGRQLRSRYALPLLFEAVLLLLFGLLVARQAALGAAFVPVTVMLLCFLMGLQNAVITKISGAVVRTTHLTGAITDMGIELGRRVYRRSLPPAHRSRVAVSGERLTLSVLICASFFAGGVFGAFGFQLVGFLTTLPLAAVLGVLSVVPVIDDLRAGHPRPPSPAR